MKSGTFTQIYIHLVFAVKYRQNLLKASFRPRVYEYMSGILTQNKHKSIIVNGVEDHAHIFLGLNPAISISDTVYHLKRSTSLFINRNRLCPGRFAWQEGYGGFSYGRSQISNVYNYINNQELHHQRKTFYDEYVSLLQKFEIEYDKKYLFDFFD